jgi:hypothetical protein
VLFGLESQCFAKTSSTINPPAEEQREGVARGQLVAGHAERGSRLGSALSTLCLLPKAKDQMIYMRVLVYGKNIVPLQSWGSVVIFDLRMRP